MLWHAAHYLIPLFGICERGTVAAVVDVVEGTSYKVTDTVFMATKNNDFWNAGRFLILNGDNEWAVHPVYDSTNTGELFMTGSVKPSVGDEFLVWKNSVFSLGKYLGGINQALRAQKMMLEDESLSIVDDQVAYTLPSGVSDVRRVEIVDSDGELNCVHEQWKEYDGTLRFDANIPDTGDGATLRLRYAGYHAVVDEVDDEIKLAEVMHQVPIPLII